MSPVVADVSCYIQSHQINSLKAAFVCVTNINNSNK